MNLILIARYFTAINLTTFLVFRMDKLRAENGQWRIPKSKLLARAVLGGWFGAKLAQRRYRHKTRKQPFCRMLGFVPVVWMSVVFVAFTLVAFPQLPRFLISALSPTAQTTELHRTTPRFFSSVNK